MRPALEEEAAAPGIPEGEGEHSLEQVDEGVAVFLVEVDEDLGGAMCADGVALPFQPSTQFAVVVDLAVEGDDNRAVLRSQPAGGRWGGR